MLRMAAAAFLISALATGASAATYSASFSASIGGTANVKAPFNDPSAAFVQAGGTFSGQFVYDSTLVPSAGSGFQNVAFSSIPGIGSIPSTAAFSLSFGTPAAPGAPIVFDLADNIDTLTTAKIQYNNGLFNGFVYVADFQYLGSFYQFRIDGLAISVKALTGVPNAFDPNGFTMGSSLINARLSTTLSDVAPYSPVSPPTAVPGPVAGAGLPVLAAFGGFAFLRRRRRQAA